MSRNTDVGISSFSYKISINGKALDSNRMKNILDVQLIDTATGSDLLEITMSDPHFEFIEDKIIIETAKVQFDATYIDTNKATHKLSFSGYISIINLDFNSDGTPLLSICCMDNTYLMDSAPKKRTWENLRRSDVASKIFKEYGLKTKIDASATKEETISQSNKTDISFIIDLANEEKEDYLVYVENGTGYYVKKPKTPKSQKTLVYREKPYDIHSFRPSISKKQSSSDDSDVNTESQKKE